VGPGRAAPPTPTAQPPLHNLPTPTLTSTLTPLQAYNSSYKAPPPPPPPQLADPIPLLAPVGPFYLALDPDDVRAAAARRRRRLYAQSVLDDETDPGWESRCGGRCRASELRCGGLAGASWRSSMGGGPALGGQLGVQGAAGCTPAPGS
jgi:hypothetical protein